jgi:ubiquinone/menaquinone biosynthesis C-methylase UbiE
VLEIGFGAGENLPFYDASKVRHLWALEPSREMRARAPERVAASPLAIEFLDLPGEEIPLEDNAADTVLVTYTLCTIPDVMRALSGMRRVLKPSGRLIFCEHGEAPDEGVKRWQDRLDPMWGKIAGGCHLGLAVPKLIGDAGFRVEEVETMYLPGTPRFTGFNYWGSATKGVR